MATFEASELKSKAGPYHFQSYRIYCKPFAAAKSIHALVFSLVWAISRIILPGLIQSVFEMTQGLFRFNKISLCSSNCPGVSAAIITRHGVSKGVMASTGCQSEVTNVPGCSGLTLNLVRT